MTITHAAGAISIGAGTLGVDANGSSQCLVLKKATAAAGYSGNIVIKSTYDQTTGSVFDAVRMSVIGSTGGYANATNYLSIDTATGADTWASRLAISLSGAVTAMSPTGGLGYGTGAGGTVTQGTNRNTGVTINKVCGEIVLFSQVNAAVSAATATEFTVTNSAVAVTDTIRVVQKSGTDRYLIFVTAVGAGSFRITYWTTGGVTNEAPVFSFTVVKAVTA